MSIVVGNIELHMGPSSIGAPDDLGPVIVGFIDGAKKTLDIAVQELDSLDIARAIVRAKLDRGVSVRLVLEGDYLKAKKPAPDPWLSGGEFERNRELQNAILRTAILTWSDFNPAIFHQKFVIRDRNAVLTGSTNFTRSGTHKNLNHVVIINSKKVAKIYAREFREIRQGHFGKLNEGTDPKPSTVEISDVPIKVLFAPDHAPEMEIMKQMAKAEKRIDFAIFTFSQSSGIDDQMKLVANNGIPIRGVLDSRQANQSWAATHGLRHKPGITLRQVRSGGGVGKLHHKLMVLDGQVIIGGSFNYTGPANRLNDENIIVIGDLESTDVDSRKLQRKLARFALKEIDRIIADHGSTL